MGLPVIEPAPWSNHYRLCLNGIGGKTVNDDFKTRFVAKMTRLVAAEITPRRSDARTFLGFSKGKRGKR